MSTQTNKELTRRFFVEGWNNGDVSVVEEIVSSEIVDHGNEIPDGLTAFEFLKTNVSMLKDVISDLEFVIIDIIAEGDKVVVFSTITGTHTGEFMGMPPTGNTLSINSCDLFRFENGKIVERWGVEDSLTMMTQFGAIPMPESE